MPQFGQPIVPDADHRAVWQGLKSLAESPIAFPHPEGLTGESNEHHIGVGHRDDAPILGTHVQREAGIAVAVSLSTTTGWLPFVIAGVPAPLCRDALGA